MKLPKRRMSKFISAWPEGTNTVCYVAHLSVHWTHQQLSVLASKSSNTSSHQSLTLSLRTDGNGKFWTAEKARSWHPGKCDVYMQCNRSTCTSACGAITAHIPGHITQLQRIHSRNNITRSAIKPLLKRHETWWRPALVTKRKSRFCNGKKVTHKNVIKNIIGTLNWKEKESIYKITSMLPHKIWTKYDVCV